ncbi:MAG: regulatory protein RecX [Candidatus Omnitrophota bacterium]
MDEDKLKKAKFQALKLINIRPRSTSEMNEKLAQKEYPKEIIDAVMSDLKKQGLLNDLKFSRLWINSRMSSNPRGLPLLKKELKEKGVKKEAIDKIMADVKDETDEFEVVRNLAFRRLAHMGGLDKATAKRRLFNFLKRRGFSFDAIMRALDEAIS